jgi:hypothetical protein
MRRIVSLVLIALVAAACGDEKSTDPQPWVDALSEEIQSDESIQLAPAAADCVAKATVAAIGADELEAGDVTPRELAAAESVADLGIEVDEAQVEEDLASELHTCELGAPFAAVLSAQEGFALDPDSSACLADALDEDPEFASAFAKAFVSGEDEGQAGVEAAVSSAIVACPDIVTGLFVTGIEQELGKPLSAEALACVEQAMAARPASDLEVIVQGGAPAEQIGEEIGLACQNEILASQ